MWTNCKMQDSALRSALNTLGYIVFPEDEATRHWAGAVRPTAEMTLNMPEQAHQWQCEGTWFVGLEALDNDTNGSFADCPLGGLGPETARGLFGDLPLHEAQLSAIRPGYPKPRDGESAGAFRYRQKRDAAHVDGLLPIGPNRRRYLREPHAWILGLPITRAVPEASPLVVWEGSHTLIGRALSDALRPHPVDTWPEIDLTDIYQAARAEAFESCPRRPLPAQPGQSILLHRHLLHGIAPWSDTAAAPVAPRIVAYFRPELRDDWSLWLY